MPSAQWGNFQWGDAEWGVADVGGLAPQTGSLTLTGYAPSITVSGQSSPAAGALALMGLAGSLTLGIVPPVGSLIITGYQAGGIGPTPTVASLVLTGYAPTLELSGENMLGFEWVVLRAADLPLAFQWVVLPQVVTGATLELTWTVIGESPLLGLTWHVVPAEIFDLFESDGVGAAAGIGEDILLPVGRVTRD